MLGALTAMVAGCSGGVSFLLWIAAVVLAIYGIVTLGEKMISALTFDIGFATTRSSAISEDTSWRSMVIDVVDPASFMATYVMATPEPVEAPIDYSQAVPQPRLASYPEEPETPSAWEAIQGGTPKGPNTGPNPDGLPEPEQPKPLPTEPSKPA